MLMRGAHLSSIIMIHRAWVTDFVVPQASFIEAGCFQNMFGCCYAVSFRVAVLQFSFNCEIFMSYHGELYTSVSCPVV